MHKTILVTGCAGFIGSHLCDFLLEKKDCRVIGVDNLTTGSRKNIKNLLKNKKFKFVKADINNPISLKEKTAKKISQIYNLACPASPIHYQKSAIQTIRTNTIGVINVLELAKKNRARILQASTSEIYGDPLVSPQHEKYNGNVNPIGPRACYDEGKRVAETLFFEYYRNYGVKVRVARIFNTFGPNMAENDGRVISNFVIQALSGKNITIYGDGSQTRSFCYVSDMVQGLYRLMNSNFTGPVNLGNPKEMTILQIAKKILILTRSKSKIVFKNLPEDDPRRRRPDITLAKKKLKWKPVITLDEGLKETIEYFRETL